MHPAVSAFSRDGCAIADRAASEAQCAALRALCEPLLRSASQTRPGVRRALLREPAITTILAHTGVPALAAQLAGRDAPVVRSILFDKSPDANWMVPWHQDATIALKERHDIQGFGPWSVKDGEHHCRPSRDVLDQIIVLRLHMDDCCPANGPLKVIPRSHEHGLLSADDLDAAVAQGPTVTCPARAGDVVLMRPHTVHASDRSAVPARRRVLHLEFCGVPLPEPLAWAEAVVLQDQRTVRP